MPRCSARPAPEWAGSRHAAAPALRCAAASPPQGGEGADHDGCWSRSAHRWSDGDGQDVGTRVVRDGGRRPGATSTDDGRQCHSGGLAGRGTRRRCRCRRPPTRPRQRRRSRRVSSLPSRGSPAAGRKSCPRSCTTRGHGDRPTTGDERGTLSPRTRRISDTARFGSAGSWRNRHPWHRPRRTDSPRWPSCDRARGVGRTSAGAHVEAAPTGQRGGRGRASGRDPSAD
jgi:hypothetical protein